MNNTISFDFDSTLTEEYIQNIAKALIASGTKVIIITSRFDDCVKEVYVLARELGISRENIHATNMEDKADYIIKYGLKIDAHFDDDYYEIESINRKTDVKGILVSLDLHPFNNKEES